MSTVAAAQLVYANLEAHESPSGFRGFQVWLASPGLDEALRDEAARHLADFSTPQDLDPGSKRARALQRQAFCRVDAPGGPWWLLARTVPTDDRDMYGRTGLFLAHAFVLSDAEFGKVHHDPFALLDAGPPFLGSKKEVRERVPEWRGGVIPAAELAVAPRRVEDFHPELILDLARFLEDPQAAPVVVPEEPAVLLAMLRPLFAWLPALLRQRAAFDTLFTGQALGQSPFRVVGTFSTEVLRTWSDQRFHQWMRHSEAFVPPLPAADTFFTRRLGRWLRDPAPPPPQRAAATYKLLHAIEEGRLEDCVPHGLGDDELRDLLEAEPVPQRLNQLRQMRVEADFPDRVLWPLVRERLPAYFRADTAAGRLERIARPLPPERIGMWLRARLEDVERPPTAEELRHLWDWLQPHSGEDFVRCRLMIQRWRGEVAWVREHLADDERADPAFWFWGWCWQTLARRCATLEFAGELLNRLRGDDVTPELLADAELFLEMPAPAGEIGDPLSERAELRFQLAYHRADADAMTRLLDHEANKALYVQALRRLERVPAEATFCCLVLDGEYYLGTRVEFGGPAPARAAALAAALYWHQPYHAVEHWRHAAMHGLPPPIEQRVVEYVAPHPVFGKFLERQQWERVTEFLRGRGCTDTAFQNCVESILGLRVIAPVFRPLTEGAAWVGLKLSWAVREQAARQNQALGAALRAITPVHEPKDWAEVAKLPDVLPTDRPRLGWLIMVLLNPSQVGRLCVARP